VSAFVLLLSVVASGLSRIRQCQLYERTHCARVLVTGLQTVIIDARHMRDIVNRDVQSIVIECVSICQSFIGPYLQSVSIPKTSHSNGRTRLLVLSLLFCPILTEVGMCRRQILAEFQILHITKNILVESRCSVRTDKRADLTDVIITSETNLQTRLKYLGTER
jgi:hypothetical protein